jgi:hypothetical protein
VMIIRDITYIKRKIISPFDISSCKLQFGYYKGTLRQDLLFRCNLLEGSFIPLRSSLRVE